MDFRQIAIQDHPSASDRPNRSVNLLDGMSDSDFGGIRQIQKFKVTFCDLEGLGDSNTTSPRRVFIVNGRFRPIPIFGERLQAGT
jgi:hypothetical protein